MHITFSMNNDNLCIPFVFQATPDLSLSFQLLYNPDENLTMEHCGQFQPSKVINYKISLNILITQRIFGQCLIKIKTINFYFMSGTEKDKLGIDANLQSACFPL